MPLPETTKTRLGYIDWMRGLACVLMFQTHCYDSWLSPQARQGSFFMYSQLGGTFPAPLFLFLAGMSFALVTEKLWQKEIPTAEIARTTILRGGGDLRLRTAVPGAGICDRLGLGAEERPAARGRAQHDWAVDDADGRDVLDRAGRDSPSPDYARRDSRGRLSPHTPWAPHLPRTGGWLWSWPPSGPP